MESGSISGKVLGATEKAYYLLGNLRFSANPFFIVDIIIVAIILYWVYIFLRETRAMTILYGLTFLLFIVIVGRILDLTLLNWILKSFMTALIVAIPVVFQPELRAALERLGRSRLLSEFGGRKEATRVNDQIIDASIKLSQSKTGALIVIKRSTVLKEYIDNGIPLDAAVSSEMIRTIFFPKSPLHDGAIIISDDRIVSARSILPVSNQDLKNDLGTRHKAGLGISESTDAIAIIISEEKGTISMAVNGKLEYKVDEDKLRRRLAGLSRNK